MPPESSRQAQKLLLSLIGEVCAFLATRRIMFHSKKKNREKVAKYFKIPLTDDKQFDTSKKVDVENLVKVLCEKAMWDVLEEVPVEVDGSKGWIS